MYKQHLRAARIKNNIAQPLAHCFVLLKNRLMFYVPYIYLFFEGYVPYIFPSLFSFRLISFIQANKDNLSTQI